MVVGQRNLSKETTYAPRRAQVRFVRVVYERLELLTSVSADIASRLLFRSYLSTYSSMRQRETSYRASFFK
jgi:hypothetical protein